MSGQPPRIMLGELSGRLYLVTRYREHANGVIESIGKKIDITSDVGNALALLDELGLELRPATASVSVVENPAPEKGKPPCEHDCSERHEPSQERAASLSARQNPKEARRRDARGVTGGL